MMHLAVVVVINNSNISPIPHYGPHGVKQEYDIGGDLPDVEEDEDA
jgi:hypothetical protein